MDKIKNQKGFAAIEVIFAATIISLLAVSVVPNVAKLIDVVKLDCETKKIYSDLIFARSTSKLTNYDNAIFSVKNGAQDIIFTVNKSYYDIKRSSENIRTRHEFPKNIVLSYPSTLLNITFHKGKRINATSGRYTLTSKLSKPRYIIFDNVGRFRGDRKPS